MLPSSSAALILSSLSHATFESIFTLSSTIPLSLKSSYESTSFFTGAPSNTNGFEVTEVIEQSHGNTLFIAVSTVGGMIIGLLLFTTIILTVFLIKEKRKNEVQKISKSSIQCTFYYLSNSIWREEATSGIKWYNTTKGHRVKPGI